MQNKQWNSLLCKKQQYARPVVDIFKFQNIDIVRTSGGGEGNGTMTWGATWGDTWDQNRDNTKN